METTENKQVDIMVEGEGLAEIEIVQVPNRSAAHTIVAAIALKKGFRTEECFLFVEDIDEPVMLDIVLIEEHVRGKVHHVHRARHVEVSIFYQGTKKERRFAPSTRVQRVLDWAVGKEGFNIDSAIAPEMELALHDQTQALPKNAHVGRFAQHHKPCVAFDLVRGVVPNGGLSD